MQTLLCDRLDYFIEKFYTNSLTKFSAAVGMKYQQVQLYTTKRDSQRIPSLEVIRRMELSGINKIWLAFGEGEIFNRNNVGKIIQHLSLMQNNKDMDLLKRCFNYAFEFVTQGISSLSTDPSRSLVYRVEDLPGLKGEFEALKILAALHLREEITPAFMEKYSIVLEDKPSSEIQEVDKADLIVDSNITPDIEAIIARTAKATAEELYKKLKKG